MTELPFNDEIESRIGQHLVNFGYDEVRRLMVEYAEGQVAAHTEKLRNLLSLTTAELRYGNLHDVETDTYRYDNDLLHAARAALGEK